MIDFVKLANEALDAACGEAIRFKPHAVQAAARVLEQAFTAAVEEERQKALNKAAMLCDDRRSSSRIGRDYTQACDDCSSAIRTLIGQPHQTKP